MRVHVFSRFDVTTGRDSGSVPQQTYFVCRILKKLGYEVIHYGCQGATTGLSDECVHVGLPTEIQDLQATPQVLWAVVGGRAVTALRDRCQKNDLCFFAGTPSDATIYAAVQDIAIPVAYSVQNTTSWAPYKIFPSQSFRQWWYGAIGTPTEQIVGDATIPDSFDATWYKVAGKLEERTLLFTGTASRQNGIELAANVARAWGWALQVIGTGIKHWAYGELTSTDPALTGPIRVPGLTAQGPVPHAVFLRELRSATYLLCPVLSQQAFCRDAVDAMLSGIPVIATDCGCFADLAPAALCTNDWGILAQKPPTDLLQGYALAEWAQQRFSWLHQLSRYEEFIAKIQRLHLTGYTQHYLAQAAFRQSK